MTSPARSIWDRPSVAHQYDDEFCGCSIALDPTWSAVEGSFTIATPIDPYAAFAAGDSRLNLSTRRMSWLMIQPIGTAPAPATNSATLTLVKTIAPPANFAVWARFSYNHRFSTATSNNDFTIGIVLSADPYDKDNRICVFLNESDVGVIQIEFLKAVGGVLTSIGVTTNLGINDHTIFEGVLIQCFGATDTYHAWAITNNGSMIYLGSTTFATTIETMGFWIADSVTTAPGNMIVGVDFIRFVEGTTFLP